VQKPREGSKSGENESLLFQGRRTITRLEKKEPALSKKKGTLGSKVSVEGKLVREFIGANPKKAISTLLLFWLVGSHNG